MSKIIVTKYLVKKVIDSAEENLNYCWDLLVDLKHLTKIENDFVHRLILFQDRLGDCIFDLQIARKKIVREEKRLIENKKYYKKHWFTSRMNTLSNYKKGLDCMVNISKAFGDAYAYYFYQNEENLYAKHLNHNRIANNNADIGKRGELEFIKNVKHIDGHFTLFHDLTNTLRYGDYSFIDLKKLRVEKIGELKTKRIDSENINLSLTLLNRNYFETASETSKWTNTKKAKDRDERQISGIADFLTPEVCDSNSDKRIVNASYCDEVNQLLTGSRIKKTNIKVVSEGLAFIALKSRSGSLFGNIFNKDKSSFGLDEIDEREFINTAAKLVKKDSESNAIIIGELLYNEDFTDKNTPGTVPLFWHPIDIQQLKNIYFCNTKVSSLFNPVHLIEKVNNLGYHVDSKYSSIAKDSKIHKKGIEHFDLFLSYIMNFLMTEDFIVDIITHIENDPKIGGDMKIVIKPNQKIG